MSITAWPILTQDSLKIFKVAPFAISLDSTKPDAQKALEYEVKVQNVTQEPVELALVSVPTEFVKIEMPGGTLKPGKEKTIKVKLDKNVADETFTKSFTLEASDPAKTRVTVAITKSARWGLPAASSVRTK